MERVRRIYESYNIGQKDNYSYLSTIDSLHQCDNYTTEKIPILDHYYCRCLDGFVPSEIPTRCECMLKLNAL